jgi:drug/metabolite transporter (DMT)-like permease
MPFYVFAWTGAVASGLLVVTAKLTSKHSISNPWLFNFLLVIITLLFTIPPALIFHAGFPTDWMSIIFAAIFASVFNIFWIFSTYALDVSVLTPLFNFRGVFAVLIGIVFLAEKFSFNQMIYIFIILMAGMFASLDEKFSLKAFFKRSIALGIITVLFLAVNNAFIKVSLMKNTLWTNNLWIAIINMIFLIPTLPLFYKDIKKLKLSNIAPIGAMGIFSTITEFTANVAYGVNLGITSLIMNTPFSMILAFLFSIFAPKLLEKHTLKIYAIRFCATFIMIYCAMQLTR